jgi:hypothetical protein
MIDSINPGSDFESDGGIDLEMAAMGVAAANLLVAGRAVLATGKV